MLGRVSIGPLSHFTGVSNLMVLYTLAFTVLIFALLGIKTLASVAVFASLYGICTGACK